MAKKNICCVLILFASVYFVSCSSSQTAVESVINAQRRLILPDSLAKKYRSGTDFIATGTTPVAWTLEMDFDRMITFRATDGINFQLSPAFEKKK